MESLIWFLDFTSRALSVAFVMIGIFGFAFKGWILESIKTRFLRDFTSELDNRRHKLSQELESYKGAIVRELEEVRASIDIRRAIALKMAESRFGAYQDLAADFSVFMNEAVSMLVMNPDLRQQNLSEYMEALRKFRSSRRGADIFLPRKIVFDATSVATDAVALVKAAIEKNEVMGSDDARISDLHKRSIEVDGALRKEIHTIPSELIQIGLGQVSEQMVKGKE